MFKWNIMAIFYHRINSNNFIENINFIFKFNSECKIFKKIIFFSFINFYILGSFFLKYFIYYFNNKHINYIILKIR